MSAPMNDATSRQVRAADPVASTWLSANAGSGKTRVLTDRVARLLLSGVPPQSILCLTYTKAAASEMQNRLFRRLGRWAMSSDEALQGELAEMGADGGEPDQLAQARRLFARAIETPGGLKIQTIHSFCAKILRSFPLEAGVSPGFIEMDTHQSDALFRAALEEMALSTPKDITALAGLIGDNDLLGVCAEIVHARGHFPATASLQDALASQGLAPTDTLDGFEARFMDGLSTTDLNQAAQTLADVGGATNEKLADALFTFGAQPPTASTIEALAQRLLTAKGDPRKTQFTKAAAAKLGSEVALFSHLTEACLTFQDRRRALNLAEKTYALHRFAASFLPVLDRLKAQSGMLDFDDLIAQTEALLARPGVADWVLYRLEGGVDHILVDEAQDTSPLQWRVIEHLTREFTAGGQDRARTLFVVGDVKQSIYSFQGADPAGFDRMRDTFDQRLGQVQVPLQRLRLEHSFRSSAAILRAVDATFNDTNRKGMGSDFAGHLAFRADLPGRVDLWPWIEPSQTEDSGEWWDPEVAPDPDHHITILAQEIAAEAKRMIDTSALMENGASRPVHAGDILILVRRRNQLFHDIIRACKSQGIEVAGADVLKLGEELAVRDLLALLSFAATPEDDLSLASVLRSPLVGWSEDDLFHIAAGRPKGRSLWEALRNARPEDDPARLFLSKILARADFLRPYEMLETILTDLDGRRRLVARLGYEVADGINALLSEALAYESREIPSLTGFLARMEGAEIDVKRRAEGRGSKLRVMTVHGSKGLEAPIVFLPDTGLHPKINQVSGRVLKAQDTDTPAIWCPANDEAPNTAAAAKAAVVEAQQEEAQRLLYVAMTRAEQWLIVAGAGKTPDKGTTWYEQVANGLSEDGACKHDFARGVGLRLETGVMPDREVVTDDQTIQEDMVQPEWINTPAPHPERPTPTLAPSDLGGAKALPGEDGSDRDAALFHGTLVHHLLEHMPKTPEAATALRNALRPPPSDPQWDAALDEARRVLDTPNLAEIFAPNTLAEVPITATLQTLKGQRVHGAIDRLIVEPDRVLAVDFKTNRVVPFDAEDVPEGLLRQMGAYALALAQIYPDRTIETAILWTRTARLMPLPQTLVHAAVNRVALS